MIVLAHQLSKLYPKLILGLFSMYYLGMKLPRIYLGFKIIQKTSQNSKKI